MIQASYAFKWIASPVGALKLVAGAEGLAAILWENDNPRRVLIPAMTENATHPVLLQTEHELDEYFAGMRRLFDVKLAPIGTQFQKAVWRALLTIPYGETRSYGEIARQIGSPTAARAVGGANNRNPISIVAPCHRVVGSAGGLTGFAGGLNAKRYLLDFERGLEMARAA